MKTIRFTLLAVGVSLCVTSLSGCDGKDNGGNLRDFTRFVTEQFDLTSDQTDPVEINNLTLVDRDGDDANAYDPLLSR
ncbi:MAG: hypothetical protein V2I38_13655 [Alcanivoracaceae bacterium]|jgi:hypothetical protein|nr:hypothetical protein [Alcanivoracaceae bacterium]